MSKPATVSKTFAKDKKKTCKYQKAKGGCKMKKMSKFEKWSVKFKNDLPDSAFAVIMPGGKKVAGKTEPRSLRKLPFKDNNGKVDVPHLRNALVRVAQNRTSLSPPQRRSALTKLQTYARRYLKTYKQETKSGEIMEDTMSKFEADTIDKLKSIITTLRGKATNKKPEDEVVLSVKSVGLLIGDLEDIVGIEESKNDADKEESKDDEKKEEKSEEKSEKKEESKDEKEEDKKEESKEEKKDEDKKEEKSEEKKEDKTEEKSEEKSDEKKEEKKDDSKEESSEEKKEEKDSKETDNGEKSEEKKSDDKAEKKEEEEGDAEEDEEESKFQEMLGLCEDYKVAMGKQEKVISKFEAENKELKAQLETRDKELSKFKDESRQNLLNDTVEKVSKFKNLSEKDKLALKQHYLESKMSDTTLEEIGRTTEDQMFSKLGEAKPTTKPTDHLQAAEKEPEGEKDISKMTKDEHLDFLAKANAQKGGFVLDK
ncbi:MAG: hypothetical protein GY861_17545 [bacterium]|nr:hypothetical protein [bacterium]